MDWNKYIAIKLVKFKTWITGLKSNVESEDKKSIKNTTIKQKPNCLKSNIRAELTNKMSQVLGQVRLNSNNESSNNIINKTGLHMSET